MDKMRSIKSYVRRKGRLTKSQLKAWAELWPIYGLAPEKKQRLDLNQVFGRSAEKVLEIGFGDGKTLITMALNAPEKDFVGIEVYESGVGRLLAAIEKNKLSNVRVFFGDAVGILEDHILDESLAAVQIFFADPWPKARHHKRRLIQTPFAALVAKKLKKGGIFHLATDWMDYAYHMMDVLSAMDCFLNLAGAGKFIPRPAHRPPTKFEERGFKLGHESWDLMFKQCVV